MTLIHLITRLTLGGSARNTIDSAAAAARAGYRTILATGPSGQEIDIADSANDKGCEVVFINSFRRQVSPVHDLQALAQTIRLIRRQRADIVHTHTSKAGFIGRLAAYLCRVPVIIHTPHGHIFHGYYGATLTRVFIHLERWAAQMTDRIVVLTEKGAREHLDWGIGRPHQFVAVPSGVDIASLRPKLLAKQEARRQLGWDAHAPYILGVGRFVFIKGFDLAVRAMAQVLEEVPQSHLVLLGDGPESAVLENLAKTERVHSRLIITAVKDRLALYLSASDVFVAPSRNEGMGRAIVEAMSAGLPIVASQVGGIPSVVEDKQSGLLVPPEDPGALARALIRLLQDASMRNEYGSRGWKRAEQFSLDRMESLLLRLYNEAATEKGLAPPNTDSHH
jgi:glycosyltransferase involved in cell wall biosynthesis